MQGYFNLKGYWEFAAENRPLARTKELRDMRSNDDVTLSTVFPAEVCERTRRDGGSVFPAHANTGDPDGPIGAC